MPKANSQAAAPVQRAISTAQRIPPLTQFFTPRAIILALVLTWLSGYWIKQSEIIVLACQGTEAIPTIPGLASLVLLVALNPLLARTKIIRPFTTAELITVFLFTTVATFMFACAIGRFLIASVGVPFYYTSPQAPLAELAQFIPSWIAPSDPEVHRQLFESSSTGHVPWAAWYMPMLSWAGFFTMFGGTLFCLTILFHEPWADSERLVFPLVRLPMQILDPKYSEVPFFRSKATWIGIGVAFALNAVNMVRGVFYGGPSGGAIIDLGKPFVGAPLNALLPLQMHIRPEIIGLGYLISTELSFSVWFSYALMKLQAVMLSISGVRLAGAPFPQEQGIGAYLVIAGILAWRARHVFIDAATSIFSSDPADGHRAPAANRWALIGAIVGFIGCVAFWHAAGMSLWLTTVYLGIVVAVAVVYARLRAETGIPQVWGFPYGQQQQVIKNFLSSATWIGPGPDYRSATIFTLLNLLSRGFFTAVSGYGIEGMSLGRAGGIRKSSIFWLITAAVALGTLASFYFHLTSYYQLGAVGVRGGLWGTWVAQPQYQATWSAIQLPNKPDLPRIIATLCGGGFMAGLAAVRGLMHGFPLHPMGYALACSYGDLFWGGFFLVWMVKSILLRYGGHNSYLAALPGFLGFAFGHFMVAGVIWGSLGAALGGPFLRYGVWFG
jgi:hypothetical protein